MQALFSNRGNIISAAFLLTATSYAVAAPSTTGISYNVDTNEVTVNGSSFGAGPKVVMFENFEQGTKYSDHFSSISSSWYNDVIFYQESDGNTAYRLKDQEEAAAGRKGFTQTTVTFDRKYSQAYVALSVKTPDGTTFAAASSEETFPDYSSWKFTWLFSGENGYGGDGIFDLCMPTHIGGGSNVLGGNEGTLVYLSGFSGWWEWDNYNHIASYVGFDSTSPSSSPVDYMWTSVNNRGNSMDVGQESTDRLNSDNYDFDRINIPGWWGNGDNSRFDALYDNIYVAVGENARARLVITDSKDYSASSYAITVMPNSWTDNQITLGFDVVPDDQAYYLHVFDANNQRSETGIRICPNCPKMEP